MTRGERRLVRGALHGMRLLAAALAAGLVAGAVAGLGSRVAMFVLRLMNSSHNGEVTHANAEMGQITAAGTLSLVVEGLFYGLPGALVYLVVRRWIPWDGVRKGLAYGCVLLVVAGSVVLDGNYEYFRYASPAVSLALFAPLYPLYGVVAAPLTERWGHGAREPPRNRVLAWSGYVVLGGAIAWSAVRDVALLHDVFHVWG